MRRLLIWLSIAVFAAIIVISVFSYVRLEETGRVVGGDSSYSGLGAPVNLDYGNLAGYLSSTSMVKALPSNSEIALKFYNFNSGERQWEKSYILRKDSAVEGEAANADITIIISSKYITQMGSSGLCNAVKKAKSNGDLATSSDLSTLQLLWKFKSMLSYRNCLGF